MTFDEPLQVQPAAIKIGDRSQIVLASGTPTWATATCVTTNGDRVVVLWRVDGHEESRVYLDTETVSVVRQQSIEDIYNNVIDRFLAQVTPKEWRMRKGNESRFGRVVDPGLHFFPKLDSTNDIVELPTPDGGKRTVPIEIYKFAMLYIPRSVFVRRRYHAIVAEFLADHWGREVRS